MMNAVKKTACALAVLATTSTAVMAESIDVKVIGTITPTSCKPTLTGGGSIDYGTIAPASLKKDELNQLDNKQLDFTITCDTPAKIALKAINGRPNTAAGTTETGSFGGMVPAGISNDNGNWVVGLGLDGSKKVGGYNMALSDVSADGAAVDYLEAKDSDQAWYKKSKNLLFWNQPFKVSWSKPGTLTPIAFTTLAGKLNVQAYINKVSELDLTKPVKLDGLATLELVYL